MRRFVCCSSLVLVVVGFGVPAHSGFRGPSGVTPPKQKEFKPLDEKVVAREAEYRRDRDLFSRRSEEFYRKTGEGKPTANGDREWLKFLGVKERQDKAEQKKLAREGESSPTRETRAKRKVMDRDWRRRATDDEIEKKRPSVGRSDMDLDIRNRALREAGGDRGRDLERKNNLAQQDRGSQGNDDVWRGRSNDDAPRGRSNDDVPQGRPNEDAPRDRSNGDEGGGIMRRGWDEERRDGEMGVKKYDGPVHEKEMGVRKYDGPVHEKEMGVRKYDGPVHEKEMGVRANDLLSNPGARINDDGSVAVNNRAKGQSARARGGYTQSSRSSGGSSSGKRSLSASQIKAIYARGDD